MIVRPVQAGEAEATGAMVVAAFETAPGLYLTDGYAEELADVARRMTEAEVLVAVEDGAVVGSVTFVPDAQSPLAEQLLDGECQIRMMAADPSWHGRGVGQRLLDACLDRAREMGRDVVFLHSTPEMAAAHRLYRRNGFMRVRERDWEPEEGLLLIAFRLDLAPKSGS